MDRNNLIQVNVIIITGLLVLLGFQSLGSPIYESQVIQSFDRMAEMGIKYNTIKNQYEDNCLNSQNNSFQYLNSTDVENLCRSLEIQYDEVKHESKVLTTSLESWGVLKDNTATTGAKISLWGPLVIKIATLFMLFPFIFSTISETVRKTNTSDASDLSKSLFVVGLFGLIVGILFISGLINCSMPEPFWKCGN